MREMKDSGVDWIGEIPRDWKVCKIKNIAQIYTGNSIRDEEKGRYENSDNARPYIATKDIDVTLGTTNYENGLYIKKNDLSFKVAYKGSTLMCIEGGSAGKKKTYLLHNVSFGNKLCCFYSEIINKTYLYFFLSSPNFEMEFANCISGLIGGVSVSVLKNMAFLIPPKENQQCIANILKDKCSKIDAIITREQAVIEKLKEYKLSVITEAVTKGLNPEAPMKDSGVEWIGEIPEGWITASFGNGLMLIQTGPFGSQLHAEDYVDNGIYVINPANIIEGIIVPNRQCSITEKKANELSQHMLHSSDIVFARRGEMGRCACYERNIGSCFCGTGCIKLRCNHLINPQYAIFYLQTSYIRQYLGLNSVGTTMANLNSSIITNIPFLFPSIDEQRRIVIWLSQKIKSIERLITCKQSLITKLTEYKKSLIYEVVTGKKEV